MVGVAQMVRAPDCDSGGRGFDSHHPPQFLQKRYEALFCGRILALKKPEQCSGFLFALFLIGQCIFRQGNHEIVHLAIHAVPARIKENAG